MSENIGQTATGATGRETDAETGTATTGHEWDGIKELNKPLPKWWLYVLYATIAWSVSRVRAGKLAFWVPLAGGAASVVIMMVLMSIVFLNDPTFLSYLDELSTVD